ncbi:MAG: hypothetical protein K1Y36_15570 [Blastocatellia bacterium]|nr:hypothetical protein [Blastocatellia bacterium]
MEKQRSIRFLFIVCFLLLLPLSIQAQETSQPAPTPVFASLPEESHQFDFWIGKWTVVDANGGGGIPGSDTIKSFGNGLAILESYKSGTYTGSSVTTFNVTDKTWTQTWLDNGGFTFQLTGSKVGDQFILTGHFTDPQDNRVKLARLTFRNITKSEFIQHFEQSTDEGKTWSTNYIARFTKGK